LISGKILVTGLARDCQNHLAREILRTERHLLKIFAEVDFFVVESDSYDNTTEVLAQLSTRKSNFNYVSLGELSRDIPERIERLRVCRNRYVDFVRALPLGVKPDFVMVIDFDIKNRALNLKPLAMLKSINWWDGIFVNQKGPYYDIYALRKTGWVEDDCFKTYRELTKVMSAKKAKREAIWRQMHRIPLDSGLIEVDSAFGGLGIYRRWVFDRFDYQLFNQTTISESEHVSLHNKIRDSGGKLFIVPAMTNFSYAPHNLAAFKIFRGIDLLLKAQFFRGFRRMLRKLLA